MGRDVEKNFSERASYGDELIQPLSCLECEVPATKARAVGVIDQQKKTFSPPQFILFAIQCTHTHCERVCVVL